MDNDHTCVGTLACVCMCIYVCARVSVSVFVCVCVPVYIYVRVGLSVRMCVYECQATFLPPPSPPALTNSGCPICKMPSDGNVLIAVLIGGKEIKIDSWRKSLHFFLMPKSASSVGEAKPNTSNRRDTTNTCRAAQNCCQCSCMYSPFHSSFTNLHPSLPIDDNFLVQ